MFEGDVSDKSVRKDSRVKELLKSHSPDTIAELIQKRIERPLSVGPFVKGFNQELPTDIIDALILSDNELRDRIYPAVGLLLYNFLHNKTPTNHPVLRGVFSLISNSYLKECYLLLANFLERKKEQSLSGDVSWETTYREAMMAMTRIQHKDNLMERYWLNMWEEKKAVYWPPAFVGLRTQNPVVACRELPLLVSRKLDKLPYLMAGMWKDGESQQPLEKALREGLRADNGWSGLAINALLTQLKDEQKQELMFRLR